MADPADDRADYLGALRRAEEAAGITRDTDGTEHASSETPVATPELPGAEPVQASDQPLTPEPVAEADTSEQQAAPAEPKSAAELQAEIDSLNTRLAEKDSFIGRQSGEVGELRGAVDELKARLDTQVAQPATPEAPAVAITQDLIDQNPAYATQAAFAQKNEQALGLAFESWKLEDPFAASTWLSDRRLEQQRAEFETKLEATRSELQSIATPLAQTAAEATETATWNEAFAKVIATRPDFLQHAERLLTEAAEAHPRTAKMIAEGDVEAKIEGLSALYDLDRARAADPAVVRGELEQQAAEAAAEAEAARQGSHVVSQTTVGQPAVELTEEESEQQAYLGRMGAKPSLERGWTGR